MTRRILSGVLGVVIAFVVGALMMLIEGYEPLATYGALAQFSLGGIGPLATTLKNSVPLVLTGLSAAIAFASGPVNLGQPGQLVFGPWPRRSAGSIFRCRPCSKFLFCCFSPSRAERCGRASRGS